MPKKVDFFPIRGHATMRDIDDLLADCGIITHHCGDTTCGTQNRYHRLQGQVLTLLKKEVFAALGLKYVK